MRLAHRVCLITGGAAGIGRATAFRFAEEGALVAICDVNEELGRQTAMEIGPNARFDRVDITRRKEVEAWVNSVAEQFGRIDVLVNNAGVLRDHLFVKYKDGQVVSQMSEEDFDFVVTVNLKGAFLCAQAVVPYMIRGRRGSDSQCLFGRGDRWQFRPDELRCDQSRGDRNDQSLGPGIGRYNIRVNAVAPGFTLTDMCRQMPEKILEQMCARIP